MARHPSVIYEAPQRIAATLRDLADHCGGDRKVAVCRELTKRFEETWHGTLAEACGSVLRRRRHAASTCSSSTALPASGARRRARRRSRARSHSRMSAGASRRQAAADVAADLGVSKRVAYETSLAHGGR